MRIRAVEVIRLELMLVEPMQTSYDRVAARPALLIRLVTDAAEGWGECSALEQPTYTEEYLDGAAHLLEERLAPALIAAPEASSAEDAFVRVTGVRGNPMAKAALEMALLDAQLIEAGQSLAEFLGAAHTHVPGGVNLGIDVPAKVIERVGEAIESGYSRVKCKIAPGHDLSILSAIRGEFPSVVLCADANGSYRLDDDEHRRVLEQIDELGLAALEQPLAPLALLESARLAEALDTPVMLDESVASVGDLEQVLATRAADAISIKPARVGGLHAARHLAQRAHDAGLSLSIGGMYETAIGRAATLAVGALPGFDLPGDLGASDRYFAPDVANEHVLVDGMLEVPRAPGIGRSPRPGALLRFGAKRHSFFAT